MIIIQQKMNEANGLKLKILLLEVIDSFQSFVFYPYCIPYCAVYVSCLIVASVPQMARQMIKINLDFEQEHFKRIFLYKQLLDFKSIKKRIFYSNNMIKNLKKN